MPRSAATIPESIRLIAETEPDRPALGFLRPGGEVEAIPCARLHGDALRFAGFLRRAGIAPGDLVLIVLDHSPGLVAAFLGAMAAGAVPAIHPYLPRRSEPEAFAERVRALAAAARARAAIADPELAPRLAAALAGSGCRTLAAGADLDGGPAADGEGLRPASGEDIAYVQLSGGTTGEPKGILLRHRTVLDYVGSTAAALAMKPQDVTVGWLPLHHDMGLLTQVLTPLLAGGRSILISPNEWLSRPACLFQAISRHRGTIAWMPNFAFAHCLRRVRDEDLEGVRLDTWRIAGNGSEPVQHRLMREFAARFAPYGLRPEALGVAYGLAEHVAGVTLTPHDREPEVDRVSRRLLEESGRAEPACEDDDDVEPVVSCGFPKPGVELRIIGEDGAALPERTVGEVAIRSGLLFAGYHLRPDLTRAALRGGWLHTGDLGYLTGGQLHVLGRKKDIIIAGGRNIAPHSLEAAAAEVLGDAAGPCAAFGVRDDSLGTEIPVVACELRRPIDGAERVRVAAAIRRRIRERAGEAAADVRLVERGWIVRGASGKVSRGATRMKYLAAGFRACGAEAGPARHSESDAERVERLFEAHLGFRPDGRDDDFFEIGGDSLQFLALFARLEEIAGRPLAIERLLERPAISRALELLAEARGSAAGSASPAAGEGGAREPLQVTSAGHFEGRHRSLLRRAARALPYAAGVRLASKLCGLAIGQFIFRDRVPLLEAFHALLDRPRPDRPEFIRQALLVDFWARRCRFGGLGSRSGDEFRRWIEVRGEENLRSAAAKGRGVVLALIHTRPMYFIAPVLDRMGLSDRIHVGRGDFLLRSRDRSGNDGTARNERVRDLLIRQLHRGRMLLRRGGIVCIAGDGHDGASPGIEVPFHGRSRIFRTGFAELAVETGAEVLPACASMDPSGKVRVAFLDPLTGAPPALADSEKVEELVRSYIRLLRERWAEDPANIPLSHMARHHRLPAAEPRPGERSRFSRSGL